MKQLTMANWKVFLISLVFILGLCLAQEQDIMLNTRPSRPERFDDVKAVKDYIQQLKDYYRGTRFGKRFSPVGNRLILRQLPSWIAPHDYDTDNSI